MLNASEWNTIIPVIIAVLGPYLAKWGITDDTARAWLTSVGLFVTASYMVWSAWNMKRVKETAIVTAHAPDAATATALSVPDAVKAIALIAVLCLIALHAAPAFADPDSMPIRPDPILHHLPIKAPVLTGNIAKDVSTAATAVAGDAPDQTTGNVLSHILVPDLIQDLTAAQAVYVALKDDAGAACNQSILTQIQAFQSAVSANPLPKVHLAYDFAVIRSLLLGIQPNSPIYNNCATIATQTGQTAVQLVTGVITGATSILPTIAALAQ